MRIQKKIFRECPFEREYGLRCCDCPNYYAECLPRKLELIEIRLENQKRENKRKRRIACSIIGIAFVAVFCIIGTIYPKFSTSEKESEKAKANNDFPTIFIEKQQDDEVKHNSLQQTSIIFTNANQQENNKALSEEDKIYIAKLVYAEARGEIFEGKVAVAAVVLNRYNSDERYFDRTSIYSLITQKNQFADISKVTMEQINSVPECMEAVEMACQGVDPTREVFPDGAKYFYAPKKISNTEGAKRSGIETLSIGNHNFHNEFS